MEQDSHILEVLDATPNPKRVKVEELNDSRLDSLREAVVDFCNRANSPVEAMTTWNFFVRLIKGQDSGDLWWSLNGNHVNGFAVIRAYQDFDNQWTAYIMFGWGTCKSREKTEFIIDDYFRKGIRRFQFHTRRLEAAFQRWIGDDWKPVATTFELRR